MNLGKVCFRFGFRMFCLASLLACAGGIGGMSSGTNLGTPDKVADASGDKGSGEGNSVASDPFAGGAPNPGPAGGENGENIAGAGTPEMIYHNSTVASTSGYQPTGDGHVQTTDRLITFNARVVPLEGTNNPECGTRSYNRSSDDFSEPFPQVTLSFGNTVDGSFGGNVVLSSDGCGAILLMCDYAKEDGFGAFRQSPFIKVQASYEKTTTAAFVKITEHQESCPMIIDCLHRNTAGPEIKLNLQREVAICAPRGDPNSARIMNPNL